MIFTALVLASCSGPNVSQESVDVTEILDDASRKLEESLAMLKDTTLNPRSMEGDSILFVKSRDWTSGFFPGMLWMMYEYTGNEAWKTQAHHYSMNLEAEQFNGKTHDMGFKIYCSFGNGYRLTHDPAYRKILLQGAATLSTRFNPVVGCIRSWDHNSDKWDYPVIIDNMMNLELLFWATRETRDSSYFRIAVRHAETTMRNHYRPDHSAYHVISYDTITGEVVKRNTHQGYSHESAWTRGQVWGLYGYTMTYRETGEERFLQQARNIARYLLDHPRMPADKVPIWDFDAPGQPGVPRDASAAAILASALYELSTYCPDEQAEYLEVADQILAALSSDFRLHAEGPLPFLLDHSTGSFPADSEVDVPIIYADYYFIEALMRKMKLSGAWEGDRSAILLKLDDLRYDAQTVVPQRWGRFVSYMEDQQIPSSIGLICESLEKGDQAYAEWIIQKNETDLFEFWNHGYDHSMGNEAGQPYWEFRNRSEEAQRRQVLRSQQLALDRLGFELVTFGAPYNQSDQVTATVLETFPEIKYWLYPPGHITTSKIRLERTPGVNIEYPVHQPSFYYFWNNYYFNSKQGILVIQGHPNSWDEARFREFDRIMQYIKSMGLEVKLPRDLQTSTET